jgi:4-amino-4-deoxy-L-arabinose transferase-like glycosyltransferase
VDIQEIKKTVFEYIETRKTFLAVMFVLLVGVYPRAVAINATYNMPLEPDAKSFYRISTPVSFFEGCEREPFFMFLHRVAFWGSGGEKWSIRLQSMAFSFILLGLVTYLCTLLFKSPLMALIPGIILALTPFMAFQATRGLRLEIYISLFMVFAGLLTLGKERISWRSTIAAGFVAGALCLTRQIGVVMVIAILGLVIFRSVIKNEIKGLIWKYAAVFVICLVLILPFFIGQHIKYGNAFHIGSVDATFWRNQEFRDQPGMPTTAELRENSYAGEMVSPGHYIFGMHSFTEVVSRMTKGYAMSFSFYYRHALGRFWPVLIFAIVGVVVLWKRGHWIWVALFALSILPFAFIVSLSVMGHSSIDARFAMHGFPFAAIFIGAGADWVYCILGRRKD